MLDKEFVLAGKAIFTVHNANTGNRYTFKVRRKEPRKALVEALMLRKGISEEAAKAAIGPSFFVNVLTGPDNMSNYTYLGMLNPESGLVRLTGASKFREDSQPVVAARWTIRQIWKQNPLQAGVEIMHAGRCCRCTHLLTVPESIKSGWGPECVKHRHAG